MKNKLLATFLLALLVVSGLFVLHFLPPMSVGGKPLRKVDLLSDIRVDKVLPADSDTLLLPPPVKPAFVDTCKDGMVCIEDYADSTGHGMAHFYEALAGRQTLGRPVRIAYFGDSFIEADILTGDLRSWRCPCNNPNCWVPPKRPPVFWRLGQPFDHRFCPVRPFVAGSVKPLFYTFSRSFC